MNPHEPWLTKGYENQVAASPINWATTRAWIRVVVARFIGLKGLFSGERVIKQILTVIMVLTVVVSYGVHSAYADETDWTLHMKVSVSDPGGADGTVWNHLISGIHGGATDSYDKSKDTIAWVETDDPVQAMFVHGTIPEDSNNDGLVDQWTCPLPEEGYTNQNCSLWRDIRAIGASGKWMVAVLTTLNGATVSLNWSFERMSENVDMVLVDLSDPSTLINMKHSSGHSYTGSFEKGKRYGVRYFEIRMEAKNSFMTPPVLPDATVGALYSARVIAMGSSPSWSLDDGTPAPWLHIDPFNGEISGIPVEAGTYTFTILGDDPLSGHSQSREYTIDINSPPIIETPNLPDGTAASSYIAAFTVSGGSEPFRWEITGNLPEGLSLDHGSGTISGVLIVPGVYDFEVTVNDAGGASDSANFSITVAETGDVTAPDAIRDLRAAYVSGASAVLMWTAPADDSLTATAALYDLRYVEDCTNPAGLDWEMASEVSSEPRPQAGALHTYSLGGLSPDKSYCIAIKSMDASSHISPLSNIVFLPSSSFSGGYSLKELASQVTLRKGYNLIAFPLMPVPNNSYDVLMPALGDPVVLYRWYSQYPGITPPQYYLEETILPGLGYMLYSHEDNVKLSVPGLEISDTQYTVALQEGWNMIGMPYNRSVMLKDLMVRTKSNGNIRPYIDAVKDGAIGNTLYYLNAANYDFASFNDDPPATLEPWTGYWIYVGDEKGVEIIFRRE